MPMVRRIVGADKRKMMHVSSMIFFIEEIIAPSPNGRVSGRHPECTGPIPVGATNGEVAQLAEQLAMWFCNVHACVKSIASLVGGSSPHLPTNAVIGQC